MAFASAPKLSKRQLQELWDWDWRCASKWMGVPIRTCNMKDELEESEESITDHQLSALKEYVEEIWRAASSIFDVEGDVHSEMGLYVIVKKNIPMKVTLKNPPIDFGWVARAPEDGNRAHLYKRSSTKSGGENLYMGGPASLLNWSAPGKVTASLLIVTSSSTSGHKVRLSTLKPLSPGTEVTWSYGTKIMPDFPVWFKPDDCCSIESKSERRLKRKRTVKFLFEESCPLCGHVFSYNNTEKRIQRKPHFVMSHADYLGSEWDGRGSYEQQLVKGDIAVLEASVLDSLLTYITKDMKGRYIPASKVFSSSEIDGLASDPEALMDEFERRSLQFFKMGILIVRGIKQVKAPEDLLPIKPNVWKVLTIDPSNKLYHGKYALSPSLQQHHLLRVCEGIEELNEMVTTLQNNVSGNEDESV